MIKQNGVWHATGVVMNEDRTKNDGEGSAGVPPAIFLAARKFAGETPALRTRRTDLICSVLTEAGGLKRTQAESFQEGENHDTRIWAVRNHISHHRIGRGRARPGTEAADCFR